MNNFKKIMSAVAAFAVVAAATFSVNAGVSAKAEDASSVTYSVKEYTPDQYDFVDFYGASGDIAPEEGDGVTTFAHAGLITPLDGSNISLNTQFMLLSKKAVEEGGDGIDGWVTYSFSKTPADIATDQSYPYYGSTTSGIFFHITNYSGTTAPNCVEVQVVQSVDGATTTLGVTFIDNIENVMLNFSLAEEEDGQYTLALSKMEDGTQLYKQENLVLDKSLFVNENGATYFSTAIYEADGCDGNHWEHRGLAIFSVGAYTADVSAENVTISQTEYTYEEGVKCKPEVTVTVGETMLVENVDYVLEYIDNDVVGTAKVKVSFCGVYGGNAVVEKTFEIVEPEENIPNDPVTPGDSSSADSNDSSSTMDDNSSSGVASDDGTTEEPAIGCLSSVGFGMIGALLALGGVAIFTKKRN